MLTVKCRVCSSLNESPHAAAISAAWSDIANASSTWPASWSMPGADASATVRPSSRVVSIGDESVCLVEHRERRRDALAFVEL